VRHVELVPLNDTRLMTVLITDSGRVEQRVIDVPAPVDDAFLGELRSKLNTAIGGLGLQDAAAHLTSLADNFPASRRPHVAAIASALVEQVLANRQDKLLMAGAANLARTEEDFSGSIYPVLEAIEEQVTLLKLFSEMEADHNGVSVSIGRENSGFGLGETSALAETSVLTSGYSSQGGSLAKLGVLGPTRMDYSNNMAAVRAVARYLSRLLGEE
jgi:heat-inducible transcriptional repressor